MSECTTFVYPFTYGRTSWGKFWQLWIKLHFIWFYFLSFFLAYYTIVISGCPRVCKIHWQLIQVSCQINTTLLHKEYLCTQLQLTLCNPINCSPSSSSVHGISQQEYWSGLPFPLLGDLPHLGTEPVSCMAGSSFSVESLIKPLQVPYNNKIFLISLSVPWITAAIHFTYSKCVNEHTHAYTIKYTVAINLNSSIKSTKQEKNKRFYFMFTYSSSLCRPDFLTYHFLSLWRIFNISCKADLLATNTLNFCLSEKVYFSFNFEDVYNAKHFRLVNFVLITLEILHSTFLLFV